MKKLLTISLCLLSFVAAKSKTVHKVTNPTYVGINEGTMRITSVRTTEKATIITFQYPGEGFGSFDSGIYIEDEQGMHYELIGQKGFSKDSLNLFVPKKNGIYELHFQPLPANTRIFDLIENFYHTRSTRYYGIREKDMPFSVCNPLPHNEGDSSFPDIDFKVDSVWITGQIENYDYEKCKFKKVIRYTPYLAEYSNEKLGTPMATIDGNGTFKARIRVVGPTWCYLMLAPNGKWNNNMFIPVMLYPNDSINLCITTERAGSKRTVKYHSKKGRDFNRLMQSAPILNVNWDVTPYKKKDTTEYCSFTLENVKKRFEDYDNLGLYLSGKYGLSHIETEMLRSYMSTAMAIYIVGETNSYLRNHYYTTQKDSVTEKDWSTAHKRWRNSNSPYYALSFSNIRAKSNTFLATPFWTALLSTYSLHNLPAYSKRARDFEINRMCSIYEKTPVFLKDSDGFYIRTEKRTSEIEKKEKYYEEYASKLYYDWMLKLIREWRKKKPTEDSVFEQACLLCLTREMPRGHKSSVPYIHQQIIQCKEFFYHPSFIRMASELLYNREKECYQEIENELKEQQ